MDQHGAFKTTAFGGFEKQSVLQYIDELCEKGKTREKELAQKLAEMEDKARGLTGEVSQLGEQVTSLKREKQEIETRKQSLEQSVANLQHELQQQHTILDEKDQELTVQQDKCRQIALRAERLEVKARKYDESILQVGAALVEAQRNAGDILRKAEEKAGLLTATTIESIQGLTRQIGAFKGDVSALRSTLKNSIAELEHRLDVIDSSIDTLDSAVKSTDVSSLRMKKAPVPEESNKPSAESTYVTPSMDSEFPMELAEFTDSEDMPSAPAVWEFPSELVRPMPAMASVPADASEKEPPEQFFW